MITELAGENRWLVSTTCHDCFVDVEASTEADSRWVTTSLFSNHDSRWRYGLRGRLQRAWAILRGRGDVWLELNTPAELDELITVLIEARETAFPDPAPASNGFGLG